MWPRRSAELQPHQHWQRTPALHQVSIKVLHKQAFSLYRHDQGLRDLRVASASRLVSCGHRGVGLWLRRQDRHLGDARRQRTPAHDNVVDILSVAGHWRRVPGGDQRARQLHVPQYGRGPALFAGLLLPLLDTAA
jgi:hypothetical protein